MKWNEEQGRYLHEHDTVVLSPLEVVVKDGKLDKALKKLKRKMASEGVLREMKRRRTYAKPSERRRRKRIDAARRRRKKERAILKQK